MLELIARLAVGVLVIPVLLFLAVAVLYVNLKDYIGGKGSDEHKDWWA